VSIWISERWGGARFSVEVRRIVHHEHTGLQDLWIVESEGFGRLMVLDGCVMLTERDEFVYHEMIAHVPLLHHARPARVLVVGGGDGGTLREILRHPEVGRATLCEIDRRVVEVTRSLMSDVPAGAFEDPRVELRFADGVELLASVEPGSFEVVLVDSTDPVGPGEVLFTESFYRSCRRALTADGLLAVQSESPFAHSDLFTRVQERISAAFPWVRPYLVHIPAYPSGMWSFTLAGSAAPAPPDSERAARISSTCRYYTPEVHEGAFALPAFVKELLVHR